MEPNAEIHCQALGRSLGIQLKGEMREYIRYGGQGHEGETYHWAKVI